jgi:hypothetical protein
MGIKIDEQAICIIVDGEKNRALGTGFSFLKDNWVVTAKHIVFEDGIEREDIKISFLNKGSVKAKVLAVHPELDIVILNYKGESKCKRPLMPGYHEFHTMDYLVLAGYSPTESDNTGLTIMLDKIDDFEIEIRERSFKETTLHFLAKNAEGGYSGGAIIGAGGNVLAIAINTYYKDEKKYCIATSIGSLMDTITLNDKWNAL